MDLSLIPWVEGRQPGDSFGKPQQIEGIVKPAPDSRDVWPLIQDENEDKSLPATLQGPFPPTTSDIFFKVNLMLLNDDSSALWPFQDKTEWCSPPETLHSHQDE